MVPCARTVPACYIPVTVQTSGIISGMFRQAVQAVVYLAGTVVYPAWRWHGLDGYCGYALVSPDWGPVI